MDMGQGIYNGLATLVAEELGADWSLVTVEGDIPLFVAGQLERREPFAEWWFDVVNDSLSQWGLRKDLHDESKLALDRVLAAFRSAGKTLPLA